VALNNSYHKQRQKDRGERTMEQHYP